MASSENVNQSRKHRLAARPPTEVQFHRSWARRKKRMIAHARMAAMRLRWWLALGIVLAVAFYLVWPAWTAYQIRDAMIRRDTATLASHIDERAMQRAMRGVVAAEVRRTMDRLLSELGPAGQLLAPQIKDEIAARLTQAAQAAVATPATVMRAVAAKEPAKVIEEIVVSEARTAGGIMGLSRQIIAREQQAPRAGTASTAAKTPEKGAVPGRPSPFRTVGDTEKPLEPPPGTKTGGTAKPWRTVGGDAPSGAPGASKPVEVPKGPYDSLGLTNIRRIAFKGPLVIVADFEREAKWGGGAFTARLAFRGLGWKLVAIEPVATEPATLQPPTAQPRS